MSERESVARTLAVAGGVALGCSLLVSAAVYWLRPMQLAYRSVEQDRAILAAAGRLAADETLTDREVVSRYLELTPRVVDLDAGTFASVDSATAAAFDYRSAIDDPALSEAIPRERDVASLGRRPKRMPAYVLLDGRSIERIVLPIYGRGMWSTIHGYVSLGPDFATIAGVRFYEHGETPGIGDRIQTPAWEAQWAGQRAYAEDGAVTLRVGSAGGVDAITGATVTVSAVDRFTRFWLGPDGYGPLLARLRMEAR